MFQKKSRNPRKSSKIPKNLILKRPKKSRKIIKHEIEKKS